MTRYEASIDKHWEKMGIANLFVSRRDGDGFADVAFFLVDLFCLGIKDAHHMPDMTADEEREILAANFPSDSRVAIHPACAKKLIEEAVAYAKSLGFAPHRDFRKARKVLSGIDASLCPREFTFGCEGRPLYIRGESDSEQRVDRVLAILERRFGPDGFGYEDPGEVDDESDVRNDLLLWLEAEPDEVPRFFEVSGLITAMQLCPAVLSPLKVNEVLWGEEGWAWEDDSEMQTFHDLLMGYWNQVADLVAGAIAPDAPATAPIIDIREEDLGEVPADGAPDISMAVFTIAWAIGFKRCTERWPEAWGDALSRPDLAPHWEIINCWSAFEVEENRDRIAAQAEAEPSLTINLAVKTIARALRN